MERYALLRLRPHTAPGPQSPSVNEGRSGEGGPFVSLLLQAYRGREWWEVRLG